jgi:hypothetical protein
VPFLRTPAPCRTNTTANQFVSFVYAWPGTHCFPDDGAGCGAELEGGLTAGPLLLPGNPGTLAASWFRPSPESTAEPVVALGGFTAGPLLLPGCPGIPPAPEFGLAGCCWLDCAFCAKAGVVTTNGKTVRKIRARIQALPDLMLTCVTASDARRSPSKKTPASDEPDRAFG